MHQLNAIFASEMYQDAADKPSARCGIVVNVSHLYEYLAVTEDHVTGDFALTGAAACCFGGTRTNDSHANSSTVCADHR